MSDRLKAKAERKAAKRVEATRAAMIRGDTLGTLYARSAIDKRQHDAGVLVRALWAAKDGGARGVDMTAVKVDGGRMVTEAIRLGALDAERTLRRMLAEADIGIEAAEVVLRVCGLGESLQTIANAFEPDPEKRMNGGCGSDTKAEVRRLIRSGLSGLANVAHGRPARGGRVRSDAVLAWMAEGARPRMEDVAVGERPDLGRGG
ncbi:MAG: hypothetical protein J0H08_04245 [Rhizobiales bacterium]|nr:hypothetical protein [Hyphomicrobiales bacterium]